MKKRFSEKQIIRFLRQAERDRDLREGLTTTEREKMKALKHENRELRQANEILRKASAYFAQAEQGRRFTRGRHAHKPFDEDSLIHHGDRGSQYVSIRDTGLAEAGSGLSS